MISLFFLLKFVCTVVYYQLFRINIIWFRFFKGIGLMHIFFRKKVVLNPLKLGPISIGTWCRPHIYSHKLMWRDRGVEEAPRWRRRPHLHSIKVRYSLLASSRDGSSRVSLCVAMDLLMSSLWRISLRHSGIGVDLSGVKVSCGYLGDGDGNNLSSNCRRWWRINRLRRRWQPQLRFPQVFIYVRYSTHSYFVFIITKSVLMHILLLQNHDTRRGIHTSCAI